MTLTYFSRLQRSQIGRVPMSFSCEYGAQKMGLFVNLFSLANLVKIMLNLDITSLSISCVVFYAGENHITNPTLHLFTEYKDYHSVKAERRP